MKDKARYLRAGMTVFGGRKIVRARKGVGSAKQWMYLEYADGQPSRTRIPAALEVEIEAQP